MESDGLSKMNGSLAISLCSSLGLPNGHPKTQRLLPCLNQTGFTFLVQAYPGCPGKVAIKRV